MTKHSLNTFILLIICSNLFSAQRKIGLIITTDYRGEISFAYRIKTACQNIDWEADVIELENYNKINQKKYDFSISIVPGIYKKAHCKNYLAIFHPIHHYFNKSGYLSKRYRKFDGYLLAYDPSEIDGNKKDFNDPKKFPYLLWYPTVPYRPYTQVIPTSLFHICSTWGNRFNDEKYKLLFQQLDRSSFTKFYGNQLFKILYPFSYQGPIPYQNDTIYTLEAEAGITLILHSEEHNQFGIPSGRIFEAAAASTVMISDENLFVKEQFGDTVLYIDTSQNGESIFQQIANHMKWIQDHQFEAQEMARKAHEILCQKFLLENQLLRLGEFHDRLSK
jgi:hypothetical protein